jgi:hypothetical protein
MATLKVGKASDNEAKPTQQAKQTWYADADGIPTTDSSKAAFHLTNKGEDILPHVALKYGFVDGDIAPKVIKQSAAELEEAQKEAEKSHRAAERAAAKGIGDEPDQLGVKGAKPAENKSAKPVESKSDIDVADNRPGANKVTVKK